MGERPDVLLVVDDDAVALERLGDVLRDAGYDVVSAPTAPAARTYLAERTPDLLICAHRLIGISGLDLIRQTRARLPHLACILLIEAPDGLLDAEGRRQRVVLLRRSAPTEQIRAVVAGTLATTRRRQRWPRKRVSCEIAVTVDTTPVRLLDVSYGGLGFLVPAPAKPPPSSFVVRVPTSAATIDAELVWSKVLPSTGACRCGAAVGGDACGEGAWRAFVDGLA